MEVVALLLIVWLLGSGARRCPHCEGESEKCATHAAPPVVEARAEPVALGWQGTLFLCCFGAACLAALLIFGPPGCTGGQPELTIRSPVTFDGPWSPVQGVPEIPEEGR